MIQANELRIGNWFKDYEDKYFQWDLKHFEIMTLAIDADEIISELIPLDEDILLKCGFVKNTLYYSFNNIEICYDDSDAPNITGEFYYRFNDSFILIQYLHQLQNLIHALTQQELNIQL